MFVKTLEIENFRGIGNAKIEFGGKSAVLFGKNGMGKSTVLDAVDRMVSGSLSGVVGLFKNPNSITTTPLRNDVQYGKKDYEISSCIVLKKTNNEEFYNERGNNTFAVAHEESCFSIDFINTYVADDYIKLDIVNLESNRFRVNTQNMPIYSWYGVHRYVENVEFTGANRDCSYIKLDALNIDKNGIINFLNFFEWFRLRQEYENSIKVEENTFVDNQLQAVRTAILSLMGEEFAAVKMKIQPTEFIAVKNGIEFNINQLSEGEKCTLALAGDIARRLAIANPSLEDPLQGSGIILIDEVDLHLHPSWQLKIVPLLQDTFPNIQFIVSTHSPKVLGELDERINIFELKQTEEGIQVNKTRSLLGWDTNNILKMFMDTPDISERASKLIRSIHDSIRNQEYNKAEELADQLCGMTDELNEEVVRARAIIARRRRNL